MVYIPPTASIHALRIRLIQENHDRKIKEKEGREEEKRFFMEHSPSKINTPTVAAIELLLKKDEKDKEAEHFYIQHVPSNKWLKLYQWETSEKIAAAIELLLKDVRGG
jgi:hypothetical protein